MPKGKKKVPFIPPGAPGHPLTEAPARGGASRATRRPGPDAGHPRGSEARRRGEPEAGAARGRTRAGAPGTRPSIKMSERPLAFTYEDEDLVAVDKPAGLPVIAPDGSRARSLYDIVTDRLRKENPKARAAVVHRLDRDTSGLILFAKHARAKRALMSAWDEIVRERKYVALVEGDMPGAEGRLDSWLVEDREGRVSEAGPRTRGAKRAVTRWRLAARGRDHALLELFLETGRKHQIRVQLAAIGHPVAGDGRYGARTDPLGRLCLHAVSLALDIPGRKARLELRSPPPPEFEKALGAAPEKPAASGRSGAAPGRSGAAPARRNAAAPNGPAATAPGGSSAAAKRKGAAPRLARPSGRARRSAGPS